MRSRVPRSVKLLLLALAAVGLIAAFAGAAAALPTFTQAVGGVGPCDSCHPMAATHALSFHVSAMTNCANCHVNGVTSVAPTPAKCAVCHGGTADIFAAPTHAGLSCGTTPGCHVPTLPSFSPASGPVGTQVTVTGKFFTGATAVTVNGMSAAFTVVSATQLLATVPLGATSGAIAVTTPNGTGTSSASFAVTTAPVAPKTTKLTPTAGKRGSTVTITGTGFGAKKGTSFVKFGTVKVSKYVSWSASKVKVKVPSKAKFGKVKVTLKTSAGTSNAKTFTVKK